MKAGIKLTRVWFDNDVDELAVEVCDGASIFVNNVYVGHEQLGNVVADLVRFRNQVYGGLYDLTIGAFGPEYANGAFHARFHFRQPGWLYISSHQQSDFTQFSVGDVASEARRYLISEPVLLDNFIGELRQLASRASERASLECLVKEGS